jgi:hypothetical protein
MGPFLLPVLGIGGLKQIAELSANQQPTYEFTQAFY